MSIRVVSHNPNFRDALTSAGRARWVHHFWTRDPGLTDGLYPQETPHFRIAGYVTLLVH
jgi:hypothetical protein